MHVCKSWVTDRLHLRGGIQFHRAAAERDHGARQAHILLREPEDVSKHLALRAVKGEDWVREDRIAATQHRGERAGRCGRCTSCVAGRSGSPKGLEKRCNVCIRGEFVTCKTDAGCVQTTQLETCRCGGGKQLVGTCGTPRLDGNRIEEVFVAERQPRYAAHACRESCRMRVHALCNGAKSVRAVPCRVHAGDHCEQHLRGADVGGGFLATNVLLARL